MLSIERAIQLTTDRILIHEQYFHARPRLAGHFVDVELHSCDYIHGFLRASLQFAILDKSNFGIVERFNRFYNYLHKVCVWNKHKFKYIFTLVEKHVNKWR